MKVLPWIPLVIGKYNTRSSVKDKRDRPTKSRHEDGR